jgi:hypothetical protein
LPPVGYFTAFIRNPPAVTFGGKEINAEFRLR